MLDSLMYDEPVRLGIAGRCLRRGFMYLRIGAAITLGSALMASATADTMKFIEKGYGRNLRISVDFGNDYDHVFGGVLNMKYTGSTGSTILDGFCADPTVAMASGNFNVTKTDSTFLGSKGLFAGYLVNKYAQSIFEGGSSNANKDRAFALQVAVWEVLTETSNTYSLTNGKFRAKNSDGSSFTNDQKAMINLFLNDFGQGAATYYKAAVNNIGKPCSQSIITPVPEPASMAALALGVGAVLRRRLKK